MDFQSQDIESNAAFINKLKKQAKRLLQHAKQNNHSIGVKNLAQAQELMAQFNGFPNWHALDTYVSKSLTSIEESNTYTNIVSLDKFNNNYIFEHNNKIMSFFDIDLKEIDLEKLLDISKNLKESLEVDYNTSFHNISYLIIKGENSLPLNIKEPLELFSLNNVSQNIKENLLKIDWPKDGKTTSVFRILIVAETYINLKNEHKSLCKNINEIRYALEHGRYFSKILKINERAFLTKEELSIIKNEVFAHEEELKIEKNYFSKENCLSSFYVDSVFNDEKAFYFMSLLYARKSNFSAYVNLKENNIFIKTIKNAEDLNVEYLEGILMSIAKSKKLNKVPFFEYSSHDLIDNGSPDENTILFQDTLTKKPYYQNINKKVNLLLGYGGFNEKEMLFNTIAFKKFLDKKNKDKMSVLNINAKDNLMPVLVEMFPQYSYQSIVLSVDSFHYNPLDTELGERFPKDYEFITSLLNMILKSNEMSANQVSPLMLEKLYQYYVAHPKLYHSGKSKEIDIAISEIKNKVDLSWWDVVDFLISKNKLIQATEAQSYAMPLYSDIKKEIYEDKDLKNIYKRIDFTEEFKIIPDKIFEHISEKLSVFVFLNKPTTLKIKETDYLSLEIDNSAYELSASNGDITVMKDILTVVSYSILKKHESIKGKTIKAINGNIQLFSSLEQDLKLENNIEFIINIYGYYKKDNMNIFELNHDYSFSIKDQEKFLNVNFILSSFLHIAFMPENNIKDYFIRKYGYLKAIKLLSTHIELLKKGTNFLNQNIQQDIIDKIESLEIG